MSLTNEIKNFALDLGYSHVGITTADDFTEFHAELKARGDMYDFYITDPREPLKHYSPRHVHPWARSIIVLVYDYMQKTFPKTLTEHIGMIYQARCYNPPPQRINGARFELMQKYVQTKGLKTEPGNLLPARWAGARAGVTTFGRNNFAYAQGAGSFIVISAIITDAELEYDAPTLDCKCPPNCRACMDACPTGAIYAPFKLNPRKCIAFNNFRTTKATGCGVTDSIPHEIRPLIGQHIHGCDLCQTACPRNTAKIKTARPKDSFLEKLALNFDLRKVLTMPPGYYETWLEPVMYNYIKEKRFFQRNAAIAMGNSNNLNYVPDLAAAMDDPAATVRSHAAWSLGRLGGPKARLALEKYLATENDMEVKTEINLALANNFR